ATMPSITSGGYRLVFGVFKTSQSSGAEHFLLGAYPDATYGGVILDTGDTFRHGTGFLYLTRPSRLSQHYSNSAVNDGNWHRVIVLEDTGAATGTMYLDGTAQTHTSYAQSACWWSSSNVAVGDVRSSSGATTGHSSWFYSGNLGALGFAYDT